MTGFQTSVSTSPALGVAGDFASTNPRYSYNAGPGALVAGSAGVSSGLFAWVDFDSNEEPLSISNAGAGAPAGFVPREQQGLIGTYLAESGILIPAGFQVTLMAAADMLAKNETGGLVQVGDTVYVNTTNGKLVATGGGAVDSGWKYASAGADGEIVKIKRLPV